MRKSMAFVLPALLGAVLPAAAQDFGTGWLDQQTQRIRQTSRPRSTKPLQVRLSGGLQFYFDDNIFLSEKNKFDDTVTIGYARATAEYAEPSFDADGDLMVNYTAYTEFDKANDFETRLAGRLRWTGPRVELELRELARRESDPTSAVFIHRIQRFVGDSGLRISADLTPRVGLELDYRLQIVRFEDAEFESTNNNTQRVTLAGILKGDVTDIFLEIGLTDISYTESSGPVDSDGNLIRAGIRGTLTPRLTFSLAAGRVGHETDTLPGGGDISHATGDISLTLNYDATDRITLAADYTHTIGFAFSTSPFQIVGTLRGTITYDATPLVSINGRIQFDQTDAVSIPGSKGSSRDFVSGSVGVSYEFVEKFTFDARVTYRWGDIHNPPSGATGDQFNNLVVRIGVSGSY